MIRRWLIKYWWVNEIGKAIAGSFFGVVAYGLYVSEQRELAFVSGVIFVLCMICFADLLTVLIRKVRGKPIYEDK